MDHLLDFLEFYKPSHEVLERQEWRPPMPFKVSVDLRSTPAEVFADFGVLLLFIVSASVAVGVVVLHGF